LASQPARDFDAAEVLKKVGDPMIRTAGGLIAASFVIMAALDLADWLIGLERRITRLEFGPAVVRGPWKVKAADEQRNERGDA
jgi:hypothetical protein